MAVKFCVHTRCSKVAVRTGRSDEHCRAHYATDVLPTVDMVRCRVIGLAPIVDARTDQDVEAGGIVELDPEVTDIKVLVYAQLVEVIDDEPGEE